MSNVPRSVQWKDQDPLEELVREFPDDARLRVPALYSLPSPLVAAIAEHVPGFFADRDVQFERRLRELGGTVLFNRRATGVELIDDPETTDLSHFLFGDPRQQLQKAISAKVQISLAPQERRRLMEQTSESLITRTRQRQQGFTGWLVTNPVFRREAAELANQWKLRLGPDATPPDLKLLSTLHRHGLSEPELQEMSHLSRMASDFLERWNITRMTTWDIPIPVDAVQIDDDPLPANELQAQGVAVFIPWWQLADQDLKLGEVIDYQQHRHNLSHLDGWIGVSQSKTWGPSRLARIFQLYVYFTLAIGVRYGDRIAGNLQKLDVAFATFWQPTLPDDDARRVAADSVRKMRLKLR